MTDPPPGVFQYGATILRSDGGARALYAEGFQHTPERDDAWINLVRDEIEAAGPAYYAERFIKIDDQNVETDLMSRAQALGVPTSPPSP